MIGVLPYLELPVCLPAGEGLPDKVVAGKFWPTQIGAYHSSYYEERTLIYYSGQPFLIDLPEAMYEDKVKQYFELVNKPASNPKGSLYPPNKPVRN